MDPICTTDTPLYGPGLPFWARPGIALFAKKTEGGGKDDEDLDEDDDDDLDEDDDEDEDDEDAEKTPEELRDELKTIREALKSASGQSKKRRQQLQKARKDHEAELERVRSGGKKAKSKDDEDDETVDAEAIREATRREERAAADVRTKKAEARGALRGAGIPSDRVAKAVGLLDLDDLDVDEDGNVDGLDDAIDELKKEWPELFPGKGAKQRRRGSGPAGDDDERKTKRKLTADQAQARLLTGQR
jgi:hypothetical protein